MSRDDVRLFNQKQQKRYAARTGITVNIEEIGHNTKSLAVREQKLLREIRPGVWLKTDVIEFPDNFTNVYELIWDQNQTDIAPYIHSSPTPYLLRDQIKNDPSILTISNGSFFFLTDQADRHPLDLPYNLCIREGKVLGLPSSDQPIAFIQDEKLQTKEPKARGTIVLGATHITWRGAQSTPDRKGVYDAMLYNSKCSDVIKVRDAKTGIQIGILDNQHITTPTDPNVFDIVVAADTEKNLRITKINRGGGTHFFDGLFILQTRNKPTYTVGDLVKPITLDSLSLEKISSGITIGKRVNDPYFLAPERVNKKDVRSLLAQDTQGFMHFIVFDGSKYIPGFHGVSAKEITTFFSPEKFAWAYFLDGGGSSRIIVREKNELHFLANEFVFKKQENGTFLWDWKGGRIVASSIALRVRRN